jgi:large exoprotein involved in heme utilization and adhesion
MNPSVNPESGLIELPDEVTDSSQQIAASCSQEQGNQFVITGRGGVEENPLEVQGSDRPWNDLRDLSAFSQVSSANAQEPALSSSLAETTLTEATTWRLNAVGQLELVAIATTQVARPETCAGR